ncbi:acylphosphatase [Terasakiella pusilla]|jgi:acylphosphatase|uniref:acylphosphatase n=1 Tax=Terasakiella pusilla TaxID=64973 RepID=UPI00048B5513|nr:acylphosphatase [Terasakiella pusilla]
MKTVHLKITGRVQGVWYRAWTRETAESLGLNGWVRNRLDGSVEALVSGQAGNVDELTKRCWDGPSAAKVDSVTVTERTETLPTGFFQEKTV